jgi:hypothetical protein
MSIVKMLSLLCIIDDELSIYLLAPSIRVCIQFDFIHVQAEFSRKNITFWAKQIPLLMSVKFDPDEKIMLLLNVSDDGSPRLLEPEYQSNMLRLPTAAAVMNTEIPLPIKFPQVAEAEVVSKSHSDHRPMMQGR